MQKNEVLSNAFQEYPCIYDKSDQGHKNKVIVSNAWKKVLEVKVKVNQFLSPLAPNLGSLKTHPFLSNIFRNCSIRNVSLKRF